MLAIIFSLSNDASSAFFPSKIDDAGIVNILIAIGLTTWVAPESSHLCLLL